ncbi:Uncharacterised protein [uncultured archaeon]|nr:Uncharacterised protein [uncultured archaeon]
MSRPEQKSGSLEVLQEGLAETHSRTILCQGMKQLRQDKWKEDSRILRSLLLCCMNRALGGYLKVCLSRKGGVRRVTNISRYIDISEKLLYPKHFFCILNNFGKHFIFSTLFCVRDFLYYNRCVPGHIYSFCRVKIRRISLN